MILSKVSLHICGCHYDNSCLRESYPVCPEFVGIQDEVMSPTLNSFDTSTTLTERNSMEKTAKSKKRNERIALCNILFERWNSMLKRQIKVDLLLKWEETFSNNF